MTSYNPINKGRKKLCDMVNLKKDFFNLLSYIIILFLLYSPITFTTIFSSNLQQNSNKLFGCVT